MTLDAEERPPPPAREVPFVGLAIFFHFVRKMAPPIAFVVGYTAFAALVVTWDMERSGETPRPIGQELYGMYTQLFFEPTEDLPDAPFARFIFWITPIVGVFLIAEGVVKVGATLLDKDARHKLRVRIMSDRMMDHVVVVGLGHVGYRVVESLLRLGAPIVAIERNTDGFIEFVKALQVPVHVGDARRDELLMEAGIERARAVVCATDDDLVNLEVAIDAKRMNPKIRVVMRMFDQRLANKVGGALELDETFSTSSLAAPLIALQATQEGVKGVYQTGTDDVRVAVEITVGPRFRTRSVAELEDEVDARIITVQPEGAKSGKRARADTEVVRGDQIVADVSAGALPNLRSLLR